MACPLTLCSGWTGDQWNNSMWWEKRRNDRPGLFHNPDLLSLATVGLAPWSSETYSYVPLWKMIASIQCESWLCVSACYLMCGPWRSLVFIQILHVSDALWPPQVFLTLSQSIQEHSRWNVNNELKLKSNPAPWHMDMLWDVLSTMWWHTSQSQIIELGRWLISVVSPLSRVHVRKARCV